METPNGDFRFSRRPHGQLDNGGWDLTRAKSKGDLKVVSLADDFFGLEIHFWAGRTTPCRTVDCPACLAGMLSRWAGYLPCLSVPKWGPAIVEFTGAAAADLDGIRERFTTLRGVNLIFRRPNDKPNGRVRAEECGLYKEVSRLPQAPAVWPIIAKIFRVNTNFFPGMTVTDDDEPDQESTVLGSSRFPKNPLETHAPAGDKSDLPGQLVFPLTISANGK